MMIGVMAAAFLTILFFPFLMVKKLKFEDGKETSLIVRNDNVKDPRYFAKSFIQKFDEGMKTENGTKFLKLSKAEDLLIWNGSFELDKKISKIMLVDAEATLPKGTKAQKEIYAKQNLTIESKSTIRACASAKCLFLDEQVEVIRWVDAKEHLVAKKNCNLGVSATAEIRVVVEPQCEFRRLYAPIIEVKKYIPMVDNFKDEIIVNRIAPVYKKTKRDIRMVDDSQELKGTIISKTDVEIGAGAIVYGDVKSEHTVHIRKGAIVTGNVFAEDAVIMEKESKVLGNVFAMGNVYIGPDARVGIIGRTKSVVSRNNMVLAQGAVIYGYVCTDVSGATVSASDFEYEVKRYENIKIKDSAATPAKDFERIVCKKTEQGYIYFDDVNEFNDIDYYGFRDNDNMRGIIVPDGAEEINESMFFDCSELEYVKIPASVKKIGDFAFFSCRKLKRIDIEPDSQMEEIGEYAFSECDSLEEVTIPHVELVKAAAFRRNPNLKCVKIMDKNVDIICSDLAFQDCDQLQENEFMTADCVTIKRLQDGFGNTN